MPTFGNWLDDYSRVGQDATRDGAPQANYTGTHNGRNYINGKLYAGEGLSQGTDPNTPDYAFQNTLNQYSGQISQLTGQAVNTTPNNPLPTPGAGNGMGLNGIRRPNTLSLGLSGLPPPPMMGINGIGRNPTNPAANPLNSPPNPTNNPATQLGGIPTPKGGTPPPPYSLSNPAARTNAPTLPPQPPPGFNLKDGSTDPNNPSANGSKPPFGSSGIDFTNHKLNGSANYFDSPDPALLPYGHFEAVSTGGDGGQNAYKFVPNPGSRITEQGYVRINGQNYTQLNPDGNYNLRDANSVIDDPEFGKLTPVDNINQPHDMWSTWLPVAVAALLGGGVAAHAGLFGGGVGADSADILPNGGNPLPTLGDTPLDPMLPPPDVQPPPVGPPGGGPTGPVGPPPGGGPDILPNGGEPLPTIPTDGGGIPMNPAPTLPPTGPLLPPGSGTAASLAARALDGGNGPNTRRTTGDGNNTDNNNDNKPDDNGDLSNLLRLLLGGAAGLNANNSNQRDVHDYQTLLNQMIDRGDYNSQYRPGYLSRLDMLMNHPEESLNDPTYQALRQRNEDNLSRSMNARGLGLSGNELGALDKYGREQDYSHINDERNAFMKAADLGKPGDMMSNAMRNLPFLFQMRANSNAAQSALIQQLIGSLAGRKGDKNPLADLLRGLFGGHSDGTGDGSDTTDDNNDDSTDDNGDDTGDPADDGGDIGDLFGP
jgi:hypothetical protein